MPPPRTSANRGGEVLRGSAARRGGLSGGRGEQPRPGGTYPEIPAPEPGRDIYLNIDIRLQLKAQELLAGRRGAIVMMEPNTGAILAMESSPSYDPNLFVTGISSANYSALLNDPARPLVNRTTQGIYAPPPPSSP